MNVFIADIDTAKLYVRYIFRPLAQCATLLKCWFIRLRVVAYESLKIKEKSSWVIPKVVAVAYGGSLGLT